jgi:RNA polymerase sigma-70 factor (ECF subfamily)
MSAKSPQHSARKGDDFDGLFRHEFKAIARTAFLIVGDAAAAEEIAQEAFAKAWARWRYVSHVDRPGAWVHTVAVRLALRANSRRRRGVQLEALAQGTRAFATDDQSLIPVVELLRSLSPMQRAVVALAVMGDVPIDEVAARVGCRPSTARVHLHRARARLAELVEQENMHGD